MNADNASPFANFLEPPPIIRVAPSTKRMRLNWEVEGASAPSPEPISNNAQKTSQTVFEVKGLFFIHI